MLSHILEAVILLVQRMKTIQMSSGLVTEAFMETHQYAGY